MKAFVTGLDGFAGQWLALELLAAGDEVAGGSRNPVPSYTIVSKADAQQLAWFRFDLVGGEGLDGALEAWRPDVIYHLAAQSSVSESVSEPLRTFEINLMGTIRLLDACARQRLGSTFVYVGSGDAYGYVPVEQLPISESTPLAPQNPYAASKAAAECVAMEYARQGSLLVLATRSFNHTGPGQIASFAVPSFAVQIASIARSNRAGVMRTGNLALQRDYSDVRDVVRAYRLLAKHGKPGGIYNVCSGRAVSLRSIVDILIDIAGADVDVVTDPARLRRSDAPAVYGEFSELHRATGWAPTIPLEQTLADLYHWHQSVEVK